ncbi:MAG: protein-methionine-sulfoxide reductase catalytic subunit MsrP, partial [bacterium]|nr:protein-methionine-sulfoxide reductase catalytic subunit MsrP [bacterium]
MLIDAAQRTLDGRDIPSSEITPHPIAMSRRRFVSQSASALAAGTLTAGCFGDCEVEAKQPAASPGTGRKLQFTKPEGPGFRTDEERTSYRDATRYNNFYEFGTDKSDPAKHAQAFETQSWSV